jgi:hypothetical protein
MINTCKDCLVYHLTTNEKCKTCNHLLCCDKCINQNHTDEICHLCLKERELDDNEIKEQLAEENKKFCKNSKKIKIKCLNKSCSINSKEISLCCKDRHKLDKFTLRNILSQNLIDGFGLCKKCMGSYCKLCINNHSHKSVH